MNAQDLKISSTKDYFLKHTYLKILRKGEIITIQLPCIANSKLGTQVGEILSSKSHRG